MNTNEWVQFVNGLSDREKDKELVIGIDFLLETLGPLNILGRIVGYLAHHKDKDVRYANWVNSVGRVFDQLKDGIKDTPHKIEVGKVLSNIELQIQQLKQKFE